MADTTNEADGGGMVGTVVQVVIEELPDLIQFIKSQFASQNPGAPEPTDADVIQAFQDAYASSVAKDEQWLAAHPEDAPDSGATKDE